MNLDIFQSTKNWNFSADDEMAEANFSILEEQAREQAPEHFFEKHAPMQLDYMRKTKLYSLLKTLPKAVLHNNFFNSNDDIEFYRQHIITDPNVYITEDWTSFRIGNSYEAELYNWVSMENARKNYKNESDFVQAIFSIANFNREDLENVCLKRKSVWEILNHKTKNTEILIFSLDIFKKYVRHMLLKFIANGYYRVEFRAYLTKLIEYDEFGNLKKKHDESSYINAFEEVFEKVKESYSFLSVGFIFVGLKSNSEEVNEALFTRICELNWSKTIGFDFVQEEDLYGGLDVYDKIVDKVLKKFPNCHYKKIYHAGETNDHLSHNIDIAVQAGAIRIGHGLNILQRIEFLPYCKNVCFQKCPISNLILGYTGDPRQSSAPILLGLGHAVSLNSGDSGKFGFQDSTGDYFVSSISYNWTLKHLKLVAIHSINHCVVHGHVRRQILSVFNHNWDKWVQDFLGVHLKNISRKKILDVFNQTNNWCYSKDDEMAELKLEAIRNKTIEELPSGFYEVYTMTHLAHMRSTKLYEILKDIPKGVLHHCHFDCNEDEDFYRDHIVNDPNVYLASDKKSFKIGTKEEAKEGNWITFSKLREEFPNQRKFLHFVGNITMLSKEQLQIVSAQQKQFWDIFQTKISNLFVLFFALHIFKKYTRHVLLKYIKNGYDRVEFRALLVQLTQYDEDGKVVKVHDEKTYMDAFDEVYEEVKQNHPEFSSGFIFFGLKMRSEEENFINLDKACSYQWKNMLGIDFVQQEDPYGSMEPYIRVGDRVLKKYAHMNYKKVYHAGETKDHLNNNVELAVRSGSVRIGHGLNITSRIQYLNQCRHICFELNPVSNLLTGGIHDIRNSTAPLLLGLGYAVSISTDDPGKFGSQDATVDYFVSAVSFNWSLKHLKLIAFHSINHAVATEGQKLQLLDSFNSKWDAWVKRFLEKIEIQSDSVQWPKRQKDKNQDVQGQNLKKRKNI